MQYVTSQKEKTIRLIAEGENGVFRGGHSGGLHHDKPSALVLKDAKFNFYEPLLDEPHNLFRYFSENKINWWGGNPVPNMLSSQVACLNHLFPLRLCSESVLQIAKSLSPDFTKVHRIESDQFSPGYISFETVSNTDHLNERILTRGSRCTSIDAVICAEFRDERKCLILIEWKYKESDSGKQDKSQGDKGNERKRRYDNLIAHSQQLKPQDEAHVYYFEPFYQLMRQTLWAEQMIQHKDTEKIQADCYLHVMVVPDENVELLKDKCPCSGKAMEETWRSCLCDPSKFQVLSPDRLLSQIDREKYSSLLNYLIKRYWS